MEVARQRRIELARVPGARLEQADFAVRAMERTAGAVQFAKAMGAIVVASAAGPERTAFVRDELGVELVMDRSRELAEQLHSLAPHGLDVYIASVGGDRHAPVLANTGSMIRWAISMAGLRIEDHPWLRPSLETFVAQHRSSRGRPMAIRAIAHVRHGLDNLPAAIVDVLAGRGIGRGIVGVRELGVDT
ncbi:zinc-binding dehydrogenase [Arthrobacter sp. I2-34]|uniref:Zinc-binding dehydrogenase n=1 Tax=Arthrobacter hankyongi TaxID=2904801 RepID=A0ABS9LAB7_9MICC|nr:zinc-binding dehydrogenase [Arthrobacter hankyongi]MCG2623422.1 zinc-binding dehydrogenase [Arthrobacter hankyongi]